MVPLLCLGHLGLGGPLPWWGMNQVGEELGSLALLLLLELSLLLLSGSLLWALLQSGAGARVVGTDTTVGLIFLCWGRGGGPESWTPSPSLLLCSLGLCSQLWWRRNQGHGAPSLSFPPFCFLYAFQFTHH